MADSTRNTRGGGRELHVATGPQRHKNQESSRVFAGMDEQKQRAIAGKGGKTTHIGGNAHKLHVDEGRKADRADGSR